MYSLLILYMFFRQNTAVVVKMMPSGRIQFSLSILPQNMKLQMRMKDGWEDKIVRKTISKYFQTVYRQVTTEE